MDNYGDYILSLLNKKRFIKQWIDTKYQDKPLIIYGNSGIGKTSLANHIFKDFIPITINIDFCKNSKTLDEYLKLSLYKKSITMMFDEKVRKKALIFDDLRYIQTNDKHLFKQIVDFSKKKSNFHVIYIFQKINHKTVQSVYKKCFPIHLSLNISQMKKILEKYYPVNTINLQELIKNSSNNFNTIKLNIEFHQTNTKSIQKYEKKYDDLFDLIETIYQSKLLNDYYRLAINDYTVISLHILENCISWIFNNKKLNYQKKIILIQQIYQMNCYGDFFYYKIHQYNDWEIINHILTTSVVYPLRLLSNHKIKLVDKTYNKFLSRSIIYTYNLKLLNNHGINSTILSKLYTVFKNKDYDQLLVLINKYHLTKKVFEKFSKYFFDSVSKKEIQNIFKNNNSILLK